MLQSILQSRGSTDLTSLSKIMTSRRSTLNASDISTLLEKEKRGLRSIKSDVMNNMLHDEEKAKKSIRTLFTKRERRENSMFMQKPLTRNEISLHTDLHILKNIKNNLQKVMNFHTNYTNDTLIKSIFKEIFSKNRENITIQRERDRSPRKTENMKRSFQIHNINQKKREDLSLIRKISNFERLKSQERIASKEISVNKLMLSSQKSISAIEEGKNSEKVVERINQWERTVKHIRTKMKKYKMNKPHHKHCEIIINRINTEELSANRSTKAKKCQYVLPIKHEVPIKVLNKSMNMPVSLHIAQSAKPNREEVSLNAWSTSQMALEQEDVAQFHS